MAAKQSSRTFAGTNDFNLHLSIAYRPIEELKLNPGNPRKHPRTQLHQIGRSMRTFGFVVPAITDRHGNVLAGNGRILAAIDLGIHEVPTICVDHLTEAQIRAFVIADNRLSENSAWDDELLAKELKALSELDLDFDLEVIGFTMGEIDFRIESLETPNSPDDDPVDLLPLQGGPAITRPGDLWILGRHRVLCGDARDKSAYGKLMGVTRANLIFTDPPYNVPISGHVSGRGAVKHREFAMASGGMAPAEFTYFLTSACHLMATHSRNGAIHFICMDWRHLGEMLAAGQAAYTELKNICVWSKHNAGLGSLYRSQHELVFVFKHGKAPHRNNVELGQHGRHRSNVWNYPGANNFGRAGEEGKLAELHPTVKPVAMIADAIMDCSDRGDLVLDPFLGSGSTLIAAERIGRRCAGIEIDPLYVDTIIRRWQTYSGDRAHHAETGRKFDERAAELDQPQADSQPPVPPTPSSQLEMNDGQ